MAPRFPATILIIRHGEKPTDATDIHLSDEGRLRAQMLAEKLPGIYPKLSVLFATAPSMDSNRPYETIKPLANRLDVTIDNSFGDKQHSQLAGKKY